MSDSETSMSRDNHGSMCCRTCGVYSPYGNCDCRTSRSMDIKTEPTESINEASEESGG